MRQVGRQRQARGARAAHETRQTILRGHGGAAATCQVALPIPSPLAATPARRRPSSIATAAVRPARGRRDNSRPRRAQIPIRLDPLRLRLRATSAGDDFRQLDRPPRSREPAGGVSIDASCRTASCQRRVADSCVELLRADSSPGTLLCCGRTVVGCVAGDSRLHARKRLSPRFGVVSPTGRRV